LAIEVRKKKSSKIVLVKEEDIIVAGIEE